MMFHVANQILHNEQDAEDAVHDAFLAIAENMQKFSRLERHKTRAFVVTIVENKAIDLYRRKARRMEGPLVEEICGIQPELEGGSPLAQCVLRLPGRYREFLRLKYQLGYSTREIAALMGISWPAARKLEQRTKDKLRQLCQEEGIL
ncbi:MAG: sigma-70 family RNA polymerase sigma factor [Clostridiales bacterium]|nr:sigma-70 family RNA polymerase sigma factor [Clostridiales bacterium]